MCLTRSNIQSPGALPGRLNSVAANNCLDLKSEKIFTSYSLLLVCILHKLSSPDLEQKLVEDREQYVAHSRCSINVFSDLCFWLGQPPRGVEWSRSGSRAERGFPPGVHALWMGPSTPRQSRARQPDPVWN